ncbi:apolipoprotein A-II [Paralichthys olivaceus]|uniref:14 kDa-apolipoprotein n=1 Tax=Paralichthys olivaceus TaxID=8255 RepID=E1NZA3_PAROL|nr:PREDICTED: uncharacterized protein LOC109632974 [Paralichthys olivaceus]FAA00690.1 TPA: 14 kDa-apolipoprotein [Paralichthys olivaceus]
MNAKYTLALILALQVSMSLCEVPTPSQELVDKYTAMKTMFYKRLMNSYQKLQEAAAPLVEKFGESEHGKEAKTYVEGVQTKPEFQAMAKIASGFAEEVGPLVDKARSSVLGAYEEHLRPAYGNYFNDIIEQIKVYLDMVMPAE